MNEMISEIPLRIRELRDISGYSVEEFALELGLKPEVYRGYEEGTLDIPISVIYDIAQKFNMDFTEIITGVAAKIDTYQVVRKGQGEVIERHSRYFYQDLGYNYNHKLMQPLLVTLDPDDEDVTLMSHKGQEFNMVLQGVVELNFNGKLITLNEGDSIYFNPSYPHSQRCVGDSKAVFLTVITE